ncbi:D-2-hydroxyacid dehydrogenase [Blautia liquoris]|uniref:D-2-hydroxyacid dehydrogenase n=1 Tax=Blautia liquoris TaxID=2779518 RepID=A0A7M2RGH2_9FIRM|nr:D-2-hydroxyacid dehydrogenase [Blautia liquoris]QOV18430.1 D-2-hydroxyacid dehydrogenase [Blautia liquoris]
MKIVVLDGYTLNPGDLSWDSLKKLGTLTVYDRTEEEKAAKRIGDAELIFTNKTPVSNKTMEACPNLKFIGVLATGYNVVDIEAASKRGITVTNIPSYATDAVAQYVFALLLELCHHVGEHSDSVKAGDWERSRDFCYWNEPLIELHGKTMGIVGFGRIGQKTAQIANAFGMNVLVFTPHPDKNQDSVHLRFVLLEELLKKSDVISLHCPLTPQSEKIINKETILKMKPHVMIINTSRGPLINEQDLYEALVSGKVSGAAVDVVSSEPIRSENPLLNAPNIILTPHIAWAPKEARERLMNTAVSNLESYLRGEPVNVVNS